MSKQGPTYQSAAKAFAKKDAQSAPLGKLVPLGMLGLGVGSMAVAVATAASPASIGAMGKLTSILDRVGLDKGPLLMFGVLSTAMGFALSRIDRASRGSDAASNAAELARANASGIELQNEILGSVQAELGGIREEVGAVRREAAQNKSAEDEPHGQASDPLFRLAASLDQLGAQIDKRIDKARRELLDSISGVASTVEVSAQQRETSFQRSAAELEALRMDMADMRGQLSRVSSDVQGMKQLVSEVRTQPAAEAPSQEATAETPALEAPVPEVTVSEGSSATETGAEPDAAATAESTNESSTESTAESTAEPTAGPVEDTTQPEAELAAPGPPTLPRELSEEPALPEPAAPIPAFQPVDATGQGSEPEPAYEGYSHETEPQDASPDQEGSPSENAYPGVGVSMESLGFAEPKAPMPKTSEGLELIDDMDEDVARTGDQTPPLFPDI